MPPKTVGCIVPIAKLTYFCQQDRLQSGFDNKHLNNTGEQRWQKLH